MTRVTAAALSVSEPIFWQALPEDLRRQLRHDGQRGHFPPGAVIYARGEEGRSLFVIETGRVEVSITSLSGKVSVLNYMGPGEVAGEIALLDKGERSADVVAATDVTGVIIARSEIVKALHGLPDMTFALIAQLCQKVRNASDMYADGAQTKASARLARCLMRIGEKWGKPGPAGSIEITENFSQADIGEFAGLSRENVNRYLRTWGEAGILALDGPRHRIDILDPKALAALAD